ncbi:MAG: hypothetical protein IIY94_02250 [Oscillospiraceae bacterium]|nr:hypothetical protein [Oscillospiraceae bacterium]
MKLNGKIGLFVMGTLFGSAGLKLLASKDARKLYTHVTAATLRCKKEVMRNVDEVQAACADILADAKQINTERERAEEACYVEDSAEEAEQA